MARTKKRTSLEAVFGENTTPAPAIEAATAEDTPPTESTKPAGQSRRPRVKQQTAYLPISVYEQLRQLAFEERAKMHDYLMEGLDHVFKVRGLPSIAELTGKEQ